MRVFHKFACALIATTTLAFAPQAQAGFELTGANKASAPTAAMPSVSGLSSSNGSVASPLVITNVSEVPTAADYNVAKGIDADAPALKVFEEHYVPDSVRAKYGNEQPQPAAATPVLAQQAVAPVAQPVAPQDIAPAAGSDIPQEKPVQLTVISSQPAASVSTYTASKANVVESWRARKGENVRDVLRRWAERQNVDLMWASSDAPTLSKEFSYVGKFQDAVNMLLKQSGEKELHSQFRSEGMNPVMMTPASSITTNLPVPDEPQKKETGSMSLSSVFEPKAPVSKEGETRWFGLSGAPLAEVLDVWAEDAGAKVIWQAENNYALKESVSQKGSFEEAVYSALSQYEGQKVRPVGQMFVAPTGEKVLVIKTDVASSM
ncbi:MAG: TcpQ domain-containing protein [Pseudobdellovibrionaceae bacterium]|jgi:hypothetical protein|nr:TcpQ domain-containing protein [Pseudobdellovibrionaceae bacterium]